MPGLSSTSAAGGLGLADSAALLAAPRGPGAAGGLDAGRGLRITDALGSTGELGMRSLGSCCDVEPAPANVGAGGLPPVELALRVDPPRYSRDRLRCGLSAFDDTVGEVSEKSLNFNSRISHDSRERGV